MSKKLKILHTMTWLAPGGGVDKNVYHTIDGLQEEYDFHLAVGHEIYHNDFQHIPGLKMFVSKDLGRTLSPIKDLKSLWWFYKLIKREKYDIVHTHETKASLLSRVAAWMAGCPYIIYGLHGVTFNDPLSKLRRNIYIWIEKLTIWMCHYIVSVSQDNITIYHENGIGKKLPYKVAYSGIDTQHFTNNEPTEAGKKDLRKSIGIQPDDFVIINIGRFSFSKAQRYTIEAFSKIKQEVPNAKLLFVGDGELIEECKQQVKDLGLEEDVIFYGFSLDIVPLLYISNLMMLTSLREGLPRVVVESGLCKVATVAFEVEGIREIILPQYHDFIVPQYDIDQLVEKSLILVRNEALRKQYSLDELAHAKSNWDYSRMTDDLRLLYNRDKDEIKQRKKLMVVETA